MSAEDTPRPDPALRAEALESLLVEKGIIDSAAVDAVVQHYENDLGPMQGARLVARAWTDTSFKERLLTHATDAAAELGLGGAEGRYLVVVENQPGIHNVVVCTLCSCYPWAVLGLPPSWYKEPAYRSRVVREPRRVLHEMGLDLAETKEVRVWDSSAEVRYMVLPQRPQGTEGMTEEELATIVGRDAMIGVGTVSTPGSDG